MRKTTTFAIAAVLIALSPSASALFARVEFSLTAPNAGSIPIHGSYLLDITADPTDGSQSSSTYRNIIEGTVTFGDAVYVADTVGGGARVFVQNNTDNDVDVFAIFNFLRTEDGSDSGLMSLELYDYDATLFDATTMPEFDFELSGFSAPPAGQTDLRGVNFLGFDLPGFSEIEFYTLDSFSYTVVPVPAAAWLLLSALVGLTTVTKRGRR